MPTRREPAPAGRTPAPAGRTPASPGLGPRSLAVLGLVLVVIAAGAGTWYLFLRSTPPASVGLSTPTPPGASSPATATPSPAEGTPTGLVAGNDLAGTWTVDTSVGSFSDFSGSFVGYRIREELATIGATEAVGRTPDVEGQLSFEGTSITEVEITADLTTLRSDDSRRDGQLRRQALETDRFPTATFSLTSPIDLGILPVDGETLRTVATGELTLHGQTREVSIPLEARLSAGVVTVVGSLRVMLADYGIPRPQAGIVLSVEDSAVMELQLHFTRS
jgi:polyisoprenoid-binding protein YceI